MVLTFAKLVKGAFGNTMKFAVSMDFNVDMEFSYPPHEYRNTCLVTSCKSVRISSNDWRRDRKTTMDSLGFFCSGARERERERREQDELRSLVFLLVILAYKPPWFLAYKPLWIFKSDGGGSNLKNYKFVDFIRTRQIVRYLRHPNGNKWNPWWFLDKNHLYFHHQNAP